MMPRSSDMPKRSVPPTRTSSVWWLAAMFWPVGVAWCYSLLCDSSPACPPISSVGAQIWRRIRPLHLLLQAAMEVDGATVMEGDLVPAGGFGAYQQRRSIWWSYGACWLPVFHTAPLSLLAEWRLSISSQPKCYRGGSCIFFLEFKAPPSCCDGLVAPSGASPATARLHLRRRCYGPDCNFLFQFRVLLVKVKGFRAISSLCESLCGLCSVTAQVLMKF